MFISKKDLELNLCNLFSIFFCDAKRSEGKRRNCNHYEEFLRLSEKAISLLLRDLQSC